MKLSKKTIEEYYRCRSVREICEELGISRSTFQRLKLEAGVQNRRSFLNKIDTGYQELDETLKTKYISLINRCTGKSTDKYGHYANIDYLNIVEWVYLCNRDKEVIVDIWETYILNHRAHKYALSVDRVDNEKGYALKNVEFVFNGFNSWKRSIYPVSVEHDSETNYFMSSEEASRFYGLRKQTINECLRKTKYHLSGYITSKSSIDTVLKFSNKKTIKEYYKDFIS